MIHKIKKIFAFLKKYFNIKNNQQEAVGKNAIGNKDVPSFFSYFSSLNREFFKFDPQILKKKFKTLKNTLYLGFFYCKALTLGWFCCFYAILIAVTNKSTPLKGLR